MFNLRYSHSYIKPYAKTDVAFVREIWVGNKNPERGTLERRSGKRPMLEKKINFTFTIKLAEFSLNIYNIMLSNSKPTLCIEWRSRFSLEFFFSVPGFPVWRSGFYF